MAVFFKRGSTAARFTGGRWVRCRRSRAREELSGHREQANIRVRRFGDRDVSYVGQAEPTKATVA